MFFDLINDEVFKKQQQPTQLQTPTAQAEELKSNYLREGALCERGTPAQVADCSLDKRQRDRVIARIDSNLGFVSQNYRGALTNAKLVTLFKKSSGWGPVGELLFNALSAAVLGGVGWAVARIARVGVQAVLDAEFGAIKAAVQAGTSVAQAEKAVADSFIQANASAATSAVTQITGALRPSIRAQFDHLSPDAAVKEQYIHHLEAAATPMFTGVRDSVQETGDDAALVAVLAAYNPGRLSQSYFEKQLNDLLGRFESHHFEQFGPRTQGGTKAGRTEMVLVAANGYSRLAIVEFGEVKRMGESRGDTHYTDGTHYFVRFVDDDFQEPAADAQKRATGDTKVVDVHAGHRFSKATQLDEWISQTRLASIVRPIMSRR